MSRSSRVVPYLTAIVVALFALAVPLGAGTIHIAPGGDDNGGDGSAERPLATIQRGVDLAKPGDTLLVAGGVYREAITLRQSGDAKAPISIRGREGEKVVLDGSQLIIGWQRCAPDEAGLTVAGVVHPNAGKIHKAIVAADVAARVAGHVFESGVRSRPARWPIQKRAEGLDTGLLAEVPAESHGSRNRLTDNLHLDPASARGAWHELTAKLTGPELVDYWKGASVHVWMRRDGNYMQTKKIVGYEKNALLLESDLRRALMAGDRYSIIEHPHALTGPGQYYVGRTAEADGRRVVYYWPNDEKSLADGVSVAARGVGIMAIHKQHITVEGLHIRYFAGEGIFFRQVVGASQRNDGVRIINCTVEDTGGTGIYLQAADDSLVQNCRVWRAGGRGILVTGSSRAKVVANTVGDSSSTCISFYGVRNGQMIDNRIYGAVGVHSNGSSCYLGCRDLLLARNIYYNGANATFQNIVNFTLFANVFDGHGGGPVVSIWPDSRNSTVATEGQMLLINNTIIRSSRNITATFRFNTLYLHNNLIGGSATVGAVNERSHNGWLGRFGDQVASRGWKPGEGSWQIPDGPNAGSPTAEQFAAIFRKVDTNDPAKLDYRLAGTPASNPAIGAGRNVQQLLKEKGVIAAFPDFDFSKDAAGVPWLDPPSMGAYEHTPDK